MQAYKITQHHNISISVHGLLNSYAIFFCKKHFKHFYGIKSINNRPAFQSELYFRYNFCEIRG